MASRTLEGEGQPILERLSLHLRRECCSDLFDERRDLVDGDYCAVREDVPWSTRLRAYQRNHWLLKKPENLIQALALLIGSLRC